MSQFKGIPILATGRPARSGDKYTTAQGFTAIKDGVKSRPATNGAAHGVRPAAAAGAENRAPGAPSPTPPTVQRLPAWLRAPLGTGAEFAAVKQIVREHRLSTVCEEAKCPNIGECWNAGTATIMLMGSVCTRACRFCAVDTGNPRGWLDAEEPENVLDSGLDVFAQNVETVRRLTHPVRDARAGYEQTVGVLRAAKAYRPHVLSKTSLMLGLGETDDEILQTMADLRAAAVDILTLGQYLRPTPNHLSVERFVAPAEFDRYRQQALALGFLECVSGPLVRSSYRAEQALARNNAGLNNSAPGAQASSSVAMRRDP